MLEEDNASIDEAFRKETFLIVQKVELDTLEALFRCKCPSFNPSTYVSIKEKIYNNVQLNKVEDECINIFNSIVDKKKILYDFSSSIGKDKNNERSIPFLGTSFRWDLYPIILKLLILYFLCHFIFVINEIKRLFNKNTNMDTNSLEQQIIIANKVAFPSLRFLLLKSFPIIIISILMVNIYMFKGEYRNYFHSINIGEQNTGFKFFLGKLNLIFLVINIILTLLIIKILSANKTKRNWI